MLNAIAAPIMIVATAAFVLQAGVARAEDKDVDWKTLQTSKLSLESGLEKAEQKGKPISAKFEMEDGKLQISTYTVSKGAFSEVIVDHASGRITKTEAIKQGEDFEAASAQNNAMSKAKRTLRSAVAKAVAASPGYRAVSAMPALDKGRPVAKVVLQREQDRKTASESLD